MKNKKSFSGWLREDYARQSYTQEEKNKAYKKYLQRDSPKAKTSKNTTVNDDSKYAPKIDNLRETIGIFEKAKIAKEAIANFPYDALNEISDLLEGSSEIRKAAHELNQKLKPIYEKHLNDFLTEKYRSALYREQIEGLMQELLKMGLRSVLKSSEVTKLLEVEGSQNSREISNVGKWEDIKGNL